MVFSYTWTKIGYYNLTGVNMGCCNIYNKSFIIDANLDKATVDISKLKDLVPAYSENISGIWRPIVIQTSNSTLNKVDFLRQAGDSTAVFPFNPLNCESPSAQSYSALIETGSFDCDYCKQMNPVDYSSSWYLKDSKGDIRQSLDQLGNPYDYQFVSDCCTGACDTRVRPDDFVPKVPVLNQNYLNKFYDFKYLSQFPASTNAGLGFNEFVKINGSNMSSFSSSPDLVIDWRIKDTISEIPYDKLQSQYDNIDQHNKAFRKSKLVSKTCGNFILTKVNPLYNSILPSYSSFDGLIGNDDQFAVSTDIKQLVPAVEDFTAPYGFERMTYNNIFIKTKKLASHWKWNYDSGVLCWYRYYNKDTINDPRPVSGVDIYISPGDVFYAKNQGPEPPPEVFPENISSVGIIKPCPSGIKVIESGAISCVIPSGSSFTYISENLYPRFMEIFNKLTSAAKTDSNNISMKQKFELAALLCTAPEYDDITVDLTSRNPSYKYSINPYFQIDTLNKDMLKGTTYGSAGKLNYIKNKIDLINTLADKYGAYLWCPPKTTKTITLKKNIKSQCSINLDFDAVTLSSNTIFSDINCLPTTDCTQNTPSKIFAYAQKFTVGQSSLDLRLNTRTRYKVKCSENSNIKTGSARVAGLYLNNTLLKETIYNTGCYVFQDNYPRILTEKTPTDSCCNGGGTNCGDCDSDSTYNLVGGAVKLCQPYPGNLSFCDAPSATFYNNSEGLVIGTRPARQILNNTLYLKRSYPAIAFNPHIDNVAFHHQGGVYYSNTLLGSLSGNTVFSKNIESLFDDTGEGSVNIEFTTEDVGIKIYTLSIEKLRKDTSDSYNCRAFPIKDKCQCFGLSTISDFPYTCNDGAAITFTNRPHSLFTPNISTTYSPKIKAYGGYKESKINEMFGGGDIVNNIKVLKKEIEDLNKAIDFLELSDLSFDTNGISIDTLRSQRTTKSGEVDNLNVSLAEYRIPNHPDPETELDSLDQYIDPLNPYGNERSITINLNNYVTTDYTVQLPSYDTSHSDIWAKVSENVDFTLQRYTTKVVLNNDTIVYDQQKKVLSISSNSPSISVRLSNPYLEALLEGEHILYPPLGSFCSRSGNFGSKGDEISSVAISFSRIPRKQLLTFYNRPFQAMGTLKKGFFHPNSGLIDRETSDPPLTPLYTDSGNRIYINYDQNLFDNNNSFLSSGIVYYSEMNPNVQRVINQIGQFSNHRKARLYLQINNLWYEYNTPNLFGFYNQDTLNIGKPFIFEYLDKEINQSCIGPWLPTTAKKYIDFNFIYNYDDKKSKIPIYYQRPLVYKNTNRPKILEIDGTRAYFYVKEIDNARVSLANSIADLSEDDQNAISPENPEVLLSTGERFRYISGTKNDKKSYVISDYNYLYHNFSDLYIDYNLKNNTNYVFNTKKTSNQKIKIIDAEKTSRTYEARIIKKRLYAVYTDKYGNKLSFNDKTSKKYLKTYTQFELDTPLRYDKAYIDFSCLYNNFSNTEGIDSFIIFRNLKENQALKKENDYILYNNNIETKWGDLIDYDGNYLNELTKYFIDKNYLYNVYPSSLYGNNFYKIIINNGNYTRHRFKISGAEGIINFDLEDNVYYNIHQKYNVDYDTYHTEYTYQDYNNYLPYMDINILPTGNDDINTSRRLLTDNGGLANTVGQEKIYSGIMHISGMHKYLDDSHVWGKYKKPQEGKYFWINLDINLSGFKSALSPVKGFYSDSMRVDHPVFILDSTNYSTTTDSATCRQIFNPNTSASSNTISFSSNTFNFDHFSIVNTGSSFDTANIYCDSDNVVGCSNNGCAGLGDAGTGTYSGNYSFYMHKTIATPTNINNIPYIVSYDAGLYNTIGSSGVPYIQRHELKASNPLFPVSSCDSSIGPRPANYNGAILNEEYQSILKDSISIVHSDIVDKTDKMANEMLFRLIYGEQQKINYERIDGSNSRIFLDDLYKYTHPRVGPKDIYKNIIYDLDITANTDKRKISGSININGVLDLNKIVSVTINEINIILTIREDSNTGTINIVAEAAGLPGGKITSKIYDTKNISKNIIVSTGPISGPGISFAADCTERGQIDINLTNGPVYAEAEEVTSCEREVITPCDTNRNGSQLGPPGTTTAIFPRWADNELGFPYCQSFSKPDYASIDGVFQGCVCGQLDSCTGKTSLPKNLPVYFWGHNACGIADFAFMAPTNRGVGPVKAPEGCFVISEDTQEITINEGDYNRGAVTNPCFITALNEEYYTGYDLVTGLVTVGVDYDLGNLQELVKTKVVPDLLYSSPVDNPTSECGICYSIDSKDPLTGKDRYDSIPMGRGYPPSPTSTSDACECENFTYGYCRNSDNAAECVCKSLTYDYTEFPYTFEYCKHSITLKGHKRRITGKLNPDSIRDN